MHKSTAQISPLNTDSDSWLPTWSLQRMSNSQLKLNKYKLHFPFAPFTPAYLLVFPISVNVTTIYLATQTKNLSINNLRLGFLETELEIEMFVQEMD